MPIDYLSQLSNIREISADELSQRHAAREQSLRLCREIIQHSANSIRALHRREFDEANDLLGQAAIRVEQAKNTLDKHPDIYHAGFLSDAQKEYAEALCLRAFLMGRDLPQPKEIGIETAAYLNGIGETAGELRRYILDALRRDDISRCEELLDVMDAIYGLLVSLDFPDALTGGLRRTADMVRGVAERTRGDLTMALNQRKLIDRLDSFKDDEGKKK
jgi:translin